MPHLVIYDQNTIITKSIFNTSFFFLISGKVVKDEIDGYFLKNVAGASRMPRVDVAKYMIDSIPKTELFKKAVAIGI